LALNPGSASEPSTLNPKEYEAEFNDFVKNVSSIVQENTQILKNDIFTK